MLNDNERSTRSGPWQWFTKLVDRLHAGEGTRARRRGWQVSRTSRGTGREYHDPRWAFIIACGFCNGEGACGVHPCATCHGLGTVRLGQVDVRPGGES